MTAPTYGITPAGFAIKPLAAILLGYQASWLANVDPTADLSPTTPEGQYLAINAEADAELWEMAQAAWNAYNREDVEGAGLDNLGDLEGVPRDGSSFTQVFCTLTLTANTYPAGTLIANVLGNSSLTFTNLNDVVSSGGATPGILMQATTAGQTPTVNPGTLTQITTPVTGWSAITNPTAQSQLGSAEELDAAYAVRQQQETAISGSCTLPAIVESIEAFAAEVLQITPSVLVYENRSDVPLTIGSLTLPPHTFAPIVYDSTGLLTAADIGAFIWVNKPAGIASFGTTSVVINDPSLGQQTVFYTIPTGEPLFVSVRVALLDGFNIADVGPAIQNALVAAAVAQTAPGGPPPIGQLLPGADVIGSQLSYVIQAVAGVYDVQVLTFGFSASPSNTSPLGVAPTSIATILAATVATNVVVTQGASP